MATENLIRAGSDCLPFHPHEGEKWLNDNFQKVPQYLFRVSFHRKSDGETTKIWAKSKDAKESNTGQETNILDGDRTDMADMLWRHLQWRSGSPSNLLSWTSSLLFALQYMFYRHHRDRVALEDITLFIIDTAQFPKEAFARDMDLISIFSKFDSRLRNLQELRTRNTSNCSECYYFGEYFSQGALKIEGKCGSATAREIIDNGLFYLRAEFIDSLNDEKKWAKRVLELRQCFIEVKVGDETQDELELQVAVAFGIGSLFGSSWAPPIAASLLGLRPRSARDVDIICKASMTFAAGRIKPPASITHRNDFIRMEWPLLRV
ncbi:uncharacterized protein N7484_009579 [Penicillium longicatenatum]|uniref:uncharacterized protein n=1 Tax=Penicillium longicatenatum TaxID=1561947 RepID=UPI00254738AD|nr:uncharacterized protein N7484_009579 [Penicillium longicatenatum]KAJ5636266.1 hypothetical protein N7484_009579 [Penicillium longicatenatum]